jgi:hypothetical protein
VEVLNTFVWLQDEMDTHAWKDEAQIHYKSRKIAEDRAKLLRDLQLQKAEGVERPADDTVYKDLLVEETACLYCSIGELLANEADIYALATQIADATPGSSLQVEKRVRKLARAFLALFDGNLKIDALAGHESGEVTSAALDWGGEVLRRHLKLMGFLRLFDSRCTAEEPEPKAYCGPVHTVHIFDLNTIHVDGTALKLNSARKAALFVLAIIGTEAVSIESFANLYGGKSTGPNYAKTFQQAMLGLKRCLPHLTVTKPGLRIRAVTGLELTCVVSREELVESLRVRRA